MNNEYMLKDILNTEKGLVLNMATALNEASNEVIYNVFFEIFTNLSQQTKLLFNIAYNNSWYTLEEAPKNKIIQEINKLSSDLENNGN